MKSKKLLPHDHPSIRKNPRLYFALTNHCNRSCPWCSVYSSPEKSSFISLEKFAKLLPDEGHFEVQLEGGEPTVHPQFWSFVEMVRSHPRSALMVLCTNGVLFPRQPEKLKVFLEKLGSPILIKISVNHHLLERDSTLLDLIEQIHLWTKTQKESNLVINVRRRKAVREDDLWILKELEARGLLEIANDFFLQRYGLASEQTDWELPFAVHDEFLMINPDGEVFNGDLILRSEAMGALK